MFRFRPVLLNTLRRYYRQYKPQYYLFEGAGGKGTHLGVSAVREICHKGPVTVHL